LEIKFDRTKTTTTSCEFGVSDELLKKLFTERLRSPPEGIGWASITTTLTAVAFFFASGFFFSYQLKLKIDDRIHNAITLHDLRR